MDWGLGHTTRIIAVGRALALRNATLILAGTAAQLKVMGEAFPLAEKVLLSGYEVTYGRRLPASWHVLRQVPRLLRIIKQEHQWIMHHASTLRLDAIISDNRYGLWHPDIPSVIISHQLVPPVWRAGAGMSAWLWGAHRRFLERFDQVWIPDLPGAASLAREMIPPNLSPRYKWIGYLSRLRGMIPAAPSYLPDHLAAPDLLVLLSGPEPQRSLLQDQVLKQMPGLAATTWLVQGLPGEARLPRQVKGGLIIPYLDAQALSYWLPRAGVVLARSGYSSLMDFACLGLRNLVLVPTPGQPEQEYLARELAAHNRVAVADFRNLSLGQVIQEARTASGFRKKLDDENHLGSVVGNFMTEML